MRVRASVRIGMSKGEGTRTREGEMAVRSHTCKYINMTRQRRGAVINTHLDRHFAHEGSLGLTHIRPLPEPPAEHVKAR